MIELGKGTPPAAATTKLPEKDERLLTAMRRLHLRHGMLEPRIAKLIKKETFSDSDLATIWTAWRAFYPNGEMP